MPKMVKKTAPSSIEAAFAAERGAMQALVDYLYADERDNYEENGGDGVCDDHIFQNVRTVACWLLTNRQHAPLQ